MNDQMLFAIFCALVISYGWIRALAIHLWANREIIKGWFK